MAKSTLKSSPLITTITVLILFVLHTKEVDAEMGVCYGMIGDNLPPPQDVITLFNQHNIKRMRLYDPNPAALQALAGSGIDLMLGLPNEELERMASSQENADAWVRDNVINHGDVNFRYIAVGNEVKPSDNFAQFLVPAMYNIRTALTNVGLGDRVKVSTAIDSGAVEGSYPPSNGAFKQEYRPILDPLTKFLKESGSPLLVNIYPYISYYYNPGEISLEYALFTSPSVVVTDQGLQYQNLFDALFDSIVAALDKIDAGSLGMVVSETGWPTGGGMDASIDNALTYNTKLVTHVRDGTPRKSGPLDTYIFAMFDENKKTGEPFENYWGLFTPDKQPKYSIPPFN